MEKTEQSIKNWFSISITYYVIPVKVQNGGVYRNFFSAVWCWPEGPLLWPSRPTCNYCRWTNEKWTCQWISGTTCTRKDTWPAHSPDWCGLVHCHFPKKSLTHSHTQVFFNTIFFSIFYFLFSIFYFFLKTITIK